MRKDEKIKLIGQPLEWWQHQYTIVNPIQSNPIQSNPIQFDFASVQAGDLRRHVKTKISENQSHATNVTLHLFKQTI